MGDKDYKDILQRLESLIGGPMLTAEKARAARETLESVEENLARLAVKMREWDCYDNVDHLDAMSAKDHVNAMSQELQLAKRYIDALLRDLG